MPRTISERTQLQSIKMGTPLAYELVQNLSTDDRDTLALAIDELNAELAVTPPYTLRLGDDPTSVELRPLLTPAHRNHLADQLGVVIMTAANSAQELV